MNVPPPFKFFIMTQISGHKSIAELESPEATGHDRNIIFRIWREDGMDFRIKTNRNLMFISEAITAKVF